MLAWLSVSALIYPKSVLSGSGQDSVQATPDSVIHVFMDLALSLLTVMLKRKGPLQTVPQGWEHGIVQNVLVLKHSKFLSLKLRGQAQLFKNNPTS